MPQHECPGPGFPAREFHRRPRAAAPMFDPSATSTRVPMPWVPARSMVHVGGWVKRRRVRRGGDRCRGVGREDERLTDGDTETRTDVIPSCQVAKVHAIAPCDAVHRVLRPHDVNIALPGRIRAAAQQQAIEAQRADRPLTAQWLTLQSRDQGNKADRAERLAIHAGFALGVAEQFLPPLGSHGGDQAPAHLELIEQCLRNRMRCRRQ